LVLPALVILVMSFGVRAPLGGYEPAFTFANYLNLPASGKAFYNTLTLAPLGTLVTAVIAFPLAYYMARVCSKRWRTLLLILVLGPFWTSQLLRYYAWMTILGARGIPHLLEKIGLSDVILINTPFAIFIGTVYAYLPLMILPIYVGLERLDNRLLEAASNLGATPRGVLLQIIIPLSMPGIAAGSMLVLILLMGDFVLPLFLGGGKIFFVGNALTDLFVQSRNWPFGSAIGVVYTLMMLVVLTAYMRFVTRRSNSVSVSL
jgi:spermidine/putrescine transport system permease protein